MGSTRWGPVYAPAVTVGAVGDDKAAEADGVAGAGEPAGVDGVVGRPEIGVMTDKGSIDIQRSRCLTSGAQSVTVFIKLYRFVRRRETRKFCQ